MQNHQIRSAILLYLPFILPMALAFDLYFPCLAQVGDLLNVSQSHVQQTLTVCLLCFGLGQLIIGPLSDRIGRRKVILYSILFFIIGSLICSFTNDWMILMIGRALQGIGACGSQVVALALVRDIYDGKESSVVFNFIKAGAALSPIIAPTIGALLDVKYGWHAVFILLACYGILIFFISLYKIKDNQNKIIPHHGSYFAYYLQSYKKVISNKDFLYFCLCGLLMETIQFVHFSLSAKYYASQFGFPESTIALLFSLDSLVFFLTGILLGKKLYHYGLKKCTAFASVLLIISGCAMTLGNSMFDHFGVLFIPECIANIGIMIILGASLTGALAPFKENSGAAAAILGCAEFMGSGLLAGYFILDNNYNSVLPLSYTLITVGIIIIAMYNFHLFNMKRKLLKHPS